MSADLAILAPAADAPALHAALHALPRGADSPIAALPPTHFARLVVIPVRGRPHLLFLARHDGVREPYLLALAAATAGLWALCADPPAAGRLPAWLAAHAVRPSYVLSAWPRASVAEIRAALSTRRRLADFVVRAPRDPVGLAHAFRAEFGP